MTIKIEHTIDIADRESFADEPLAYDEYRRQRIVSAAVALVHDVLYRGGDGTVEEQDLLLASVLLKLADSVHHGAYMAVMMKAAKARMGL